MCVCVGGGGCRERERERERKRPADKDTLGRGRAASEDFKLFETCFPQKFSVFMSAPLSATFVTVCV
jgi:hypothetical protein